MVPGKVPLLGAYEVSSLRLTQEPKQAVPGKSCWGDGAARRKASSEADAKLGSGSPEWRRRLLSDVVCLLPRLLHPQSSERLVRGLDRLPQHPRHPEPAQLQTSHEHLLQPAPDSQHVRSFWKVPVPLITTSCLSFRSLRVVRGWEGPDRSSGSGLLYSCHSKS